VLVVTGAAATGKSTLGDHLRGRPGLLVVDGDVLGRGAAATADGRRDYVGFWRYVLAISREVRANGLVPVVPCICMPEQVLTATTDETVHFLALLSDAETVRSRIANRTCASDVPSPESHVELDHRLREVAGVPEPHTWRTYDVRTGGVRRTLDVGTAWVDGLIP
jgi:hypothetical protein